MADPNWYHPKDHRRSSAPQMWIAGCSIAHGFGVQEDQRYGAILAERLKLPVSWLTLTGSSIDWAADQILRSDLIPGDIVVWGITGVNRRTWFQQKELKRLCTGTIYSKDNWIISDGSSARNLDQGYLIEMLLDPANLCYALRHIMQVENFCHKMGVKLVTFLHKELSGPGDIDIMTDYLSRKTHYLDLPVFQNVYLDRGNDPVGHPGPLTHLRWSEILFDHITKGS